MIQNHLANRPRSACYFTSNRRFASGRRPGWLRPRKVRSSRTWVNHSNRRRSRRRAARPPTGPSSRKSTMTATSFRRRQTSCRRSTSTASDRCRQPGHDKAPRPPDSERLRADTRKTPLQRGKAGGQGKAWCGQGDWSKRLTSRSSARKWLRKCHWPGSPSRGAAKALETVPWAATPSP